MKAHRGFTLPELMVSICVLALLVAIIMPNFVGAHTQARILLCQNNLHQIRQATQVFAAERTNWDLLPLATDGGWVAEVISRAGGSMEILKCPEGTDLHEGTPVESQIVIRTSPTSSTCIPFVGLMDGGGFKILKLSQTQYDAGIAESARYQPVPYVPDANPNLYWWGYDDGAIGSGDYDFQDLAIRITKHGDGTATVFCITETAGKPELWSPDLKTCYAPWDQTNKHLNKSLKGIDFKLSIGGASHYGMNVAKIDMRSPGKIQALDYLNVTATGADKWDNPVWDDDADGRPDFLRHRGGLNVLYTDGGVRYKHREDVDPEDVQIERERWRP